MKKIIITLFLVGLLLLSLTVYAMANSISVSSLIEPKWEQTGKQTNNDLKGISVNGDVTFGNDFTLWFDFTSRIDETDSGDIDLDNHYIKLSCLDLIENDAAILEITAGYNWLSCDIPNTNNSKYTGYIIGLDGKLWLSEKSELEGAVGYSIHGKGKVGSADEDATILLSNITYSYFFAGNLGTSLGYKFEQYKLSDTNKKTTFSGPTFGLTYQF